MTLGKYDKESIAKKTMPSSEADAFIYANSPQKLAELGMSREQMLQYGLNLKSAREKEDALATQLGGGKTNIQRPAQYGKEFLPITSAQQAFDISKNPEELRRRGMSATEALKFGKTTLEKEEEEEAMRGSLGEMLSRQKQRKSGASSFFRQPSQPSMIGKSFGSMMQ
jgi:hypothetical protein